MKLVWAVALPLVFIFVDFLYADAEFIYTDLGTLGGRNSAATAINNRGQVVGAAASHVTQTWREYDWSAHTWITHREASEQYNAFLYDHGTMIDLGRADEASTALGINNSGRVVGDVGNATNTERAFRLRFGPLDETDELGFLDTEIQMSRAVAINDNNLIVGNTYNAKGYAAFMYRNDHMTDLGPLLGAPSHVRSINNNGIVV